MGARTEQYFPSAHRARVSSGRSAGLERDPGSPAWRSQAPGPRQCSDLQKIGHCAALILIGIVACAAKPDGSAQVHDAAVVQQAALDADVQYPFLPLSLLVASAGDSTVQPDEMFSKEMYRVMLPGLAAARGTGLRQEARTTGLAAPAEREPRPDLHFLDHRNFALHLETGQLSAIADLPVTTARLP